MKFGTKILVYTITLMLTSCVSKKDAYSVSNHDMNYGSLQLLCRNGDGKILGSQDLLIGANKINICLERSGDKVLLERKLRVNSYSKNLTRLSFRCDEKSLVDFLSLNSNREVAIVFDGKVIATAMTGRPGGG